MNAIYRIKIVEHSLKDDEYHVQYKKLLLVDYIFILLIVTMPLVKFVGKWQEAGVFVRWAEAEECIDKLKDKRPKPSGNYIKRVWYRYY